MKKHLLLSLTVCAFILPLKLKANESYRSFLADRFDAQISAQYFTTSSNFDTGGSKRDLAAGASLHNLSLLTTARYVYFNNLGISSGLNFNNVETNNGVIARNSSSLTNYFFGADYQLLNSDSWSLYVDAQYSLSNEEIDLNSDSALVSDGADELKANAVAVLKSESFHSFARLGVNSRNKGLSSLLLYGGGVEYAFGTLVLGTELSGYSSMTEDESTSQPAVRNNFITKVDGGSQRYFAINPSQLDAQLYCSYHFGELVLKVNAGATVLGANTADGYMGGIALAWGFGGVKKVKKQTFKLDGVEKENAFKVDTNDGVNQEIFKQKVPAVQPPPKK